MKKIYADYAATTPTDPEVAEAMLPYFTKVFANPSSIHSFGCAARDEIVNAKDKIARFLNCKSEEIFFTSCGTESNNLAILGVARANKRRGDHLITTAIEHPSIYNACRALEKEGYKVTYLPVNKNGLVDLKTLEKEISKKTILISIHLANSEIGVIQDIPAIAKIAKRKNAYLHTDACQAGAFLDLDVKKLGVDLLSFNGSKIYGPKGIAVLWVKEDTDISPIFYGGSQQTSLRSGTENVPGIIGLAKAVEIVQKRRVKDSRSVGDLRDKLQRLLEKNSHIQINAKDAPRLPNHLSLTLNGLTNRNLVREMDGMGIEVSSGSACSSRSTVESRVLIGIGLSIYQIHSTLRVSLGRGTTSSDIQKIASAINTILA